MSDCDRRETLVRTALDAHAGPLGRYAARLAGSASAAEDAVQETLLRLWEDPAPPDERRLAQWLFTVCRNIVLDSRRKEKHMNAWKMAQPGAAAATAPGPAEAAERSETSSQALRALGGLSENQREVVRLKFQNGFSYKQISSITGLSVSNVGFLIHTAIRNIRTRLGASAPAPRRSQS